MYDKTLPKPRNLVNPNHERPAIDPQIPGCDHDSLKASVAAFAAGTAPGGRFPQGPGQPSIRLGHCLTCGSTLVLPPHLDDDATEPAINLYELRGGAR